MSFYYSDTVNFFKSLTFIVYLRRSSEDSEDRQILSIPGQEKEVNELLINKFDLKVVEILRESRSAFKLGRPDFEWMMEQLKNSKVNGILTWHPNRLSRNYSDGGNLVQALADGTLKAVLTPNGIFQGNPRDEEYLMNEFTRATRDSGDKSEAVKRGNKIKFFEKRVWAGPAKPGYLNFENPITKDKLIEVDEKRYPIIQDTFKLILSGSYTPMEALDKLNNQWGFRTRLTKRQGGKPMCKSAFYRMLSDPYYYGLMIRKEGQGPGTHKAMLTEEEFNKLQILLGGKGRAHLTKHELPYKGYLKCGACGGSITAEEKWHIVCTVCKSKFHKSKDRTSCPECGLLIEKMISPKIYHHILYTCVKSKKKLCKQPSINVKNIEAKIVQELDKFDISENLKNWAIKYLGELNESETANREKYRLNLESAKNSCIQRLDNLLKLKISLQNANSEVVTEDEYTSQR
jgi:DNA invertase Pin-like site-specific DNA recombinase